MAARTQLWRRPHIIPNPALRWMFALGVGIYLAATIGTLDINWNRVAEGWPRAQRFFSGFMPPDFYSRGDDILKGLLESLWMTVAATALGILISVPVAIGGARNVSPAPVYLFCRSLMAVSRTFHEVLIAIFFVKLFGFGPFAGVATLTMATVGFYAKLLAEDIESTSAAQSEAILATGAAWLQWLDYAIRPQVRPRAIGLAVYRLDINFRESAIIGIVGAGGVGATLNTAFDRYEFDTAAAILLIIIGIVMAAEYMSGRIRRAVQ
ncbi:MAG: phosphonate ABC transporter, permease protein PhnE [Rhodospirillaceae bacterium]|nr:phosphonate ABC transporter, permease protein PhnE [Rhodospirillaceae bacterium]